MDICSEDISQEQRLLLVNHVRRFGDLNTDAILDSQCKIFMAPSIDGFIGYRIKGNCAVVFGDPLCAPCDQLKLANAFKNYCKQHQFNVTYAIISDHFAKSAINHYGSVSIQFGHKLFLDPSDNPSNKKGSKGSLVRKKVRHALKEGVEIKEYLLNDSELENEITEARNAWQRSRHGPQVYIAYPNLFKDRTGKRWFYAKQGELLVGFLILNQLHLGASWLLNNLIISKDAPSGTSELLITSVLETLNVEGCKSVVVGPVVANEISHIHGLGKFSTRIVKVIFKIAKSIFRLDKQTVFWDKFQPEKAPAYLMFDKVNISTIKALLSAMNVKI